MSKPLTIDELKALPVGDWVWLVKLRNDINGITGYYRITEDKYYTAMYLHGVITQAIVYADYGTKWLAYKNKEQAEAEEYKMDYNPDGGWEVRKYIPAHYQPYFTADTKEQAQQRLKELQGK